MNGLKSVAIALVLFVSLLLSGVACVLMAMSMRQQPPISDAEVVVAGVGNSGNSVGVGVSTRRLARQVVERDVAPTIDDTTLRTTSDSLIARAKEGDVEAAAFDFELAAAQREKAKASAAAPGN